MVIAIFACGKDDPLKGIDKKALFAPPSSDEIAEVKTDWAQRNLKPENFKIEEIHEIYPQQLYLNIISFTIRNQKQYAGALIPVTSKVLPVHLYVFGFSLRDPISYVNQKIAPPEVSEVPFVFVVPALKGQKLSIKINGITYNSPFSEGSRNDAFDGAVDDGISALNAVIGNFKEADPEKVFVRGGSRGGTVALLMAERDKRIRLAVGIAFPVDLMSLTSTHQNDDTYKFQFLDELIAGDKTIEETRKKMIASSPYYFCEDLPKIQIHFGEKDEITPPSEGELLYNKMKELGLEKNIEFYKYADRFHENITSDNPELQERIDQFIEQL